MNFPRTILAIATIATIVTIVVWLATGRHYYTKFTTIERIPTRIDVDDPLLETGFYDNTMPLTTVRHDDFHLGLLPVPQELFDKHIVSVVSILGAVWTIAIWILRRVQKRMPT